MEKSDYKKLVVELIDNSTTDNWEEASLEWYFSHCIESSNGTCLCGHKLHNLYYIVNSINSKELIVGSSCVKKFENQELRLAVASVEREILEKRKEAKRLESIANKYEKLKSTQINNGVPPSIRKEFISNRFSMNIINQFEFDFYSQVWSFTSLSDKQIALKEKINKKLLASIS